MMNGQGDKTAMSLVFVPLCFMLAPFLQVQETAATRQAFLKLLDRPRVEANERETGRKTSNGLVHIQWDFVSEQRAGKAPERVPALLVRPDKQSKFPVVIVLHGTGGNKEGMKSWLESFANKGVAAIAIDARYHGERNGARNKAEGYTEAITRAWQDPDPRREHPWFYDTCWDLWRLVDVLQKRDDIDPNRIGMLGTSMGGIQTWLAASVDERVKVAAPLIGVQSMRYGLENDGWHARANTVKKAHEAAARDLGAPEVNVRVARELWSKVLPGILDQFDGPAMMPLFAPRPLYIGNGEKDPNCPIKGARLAFAAAEKAYAAKDASDRLKIDVAEGVAHKVTDEQRADSIDWCVRWLKAKP